MEYGVDEAGTIPHVIEIIRPMKEGSTEPYLCKCDDGILYVLKSKPSMTPKNLLAEYVSGCLASKSGLYVPEFKIVYVPEELIEYTPVLQSKIQAGHAFASRYIEGALAITFAQSRNCNIVPEAHQKLIYAFDKLILNGDRTLTVHGGNPNILFDIANHSYYLIDHNLSFDQNILPEDQFIHVYGPRNREWQYDLVDTEELSLKLSDSINNLPDILSNVPEDWGIEHSLFQLVITTLDAGKTDKFWSSIE